ncbi:MAG TPA: hypothetical protein VLV83_09360 [Acidobacteriota bacterium]|nr:hypothetical protein [Acidobacteriota bacterium]
MMRKLGYFVVAGIVLLGLAAGAAWLPLAESPEFEQAWWLRLNETLSSPLAKPWIERLTEDYFPSAGARAELIAKLDPEARSLLRTRQGIPQQGPDGRFILTFPHTANGGGTGLQIESSVFLINNSGVQTQASIFFRDGQGQGLNVTTDQGQSDAFDVTLEAGQAFRLRTDGQGTLSTGWIEVLSDIPLSGSGSFITRQQNSGTVLSEVGIADSPRVQDATLFLDTTSGKNTGFAVANPSPDQTASLDLVLRDLDGSQVASGQIDLAPSNQRAEFVTETFQGVDLTNFKGVLRITSDEPVAVVALQTRGTLLTSLPTAPFVDVDEPDDDTPDLIFPRMADGLFGNLRFTTTLTFLNNTDLDAQLNIRIRDTGGQDLPLSFGEMQGSNLTVDVPARGGAQLVSDGSTDPGAIGWIQVVSEVPVTGSAAFTLEDLSQGVVLSDVGVPSALLADHYSLFAEVGGGVNTGVGITNAAEAPIDVRFRLFEESQDAPAAAFTTRRASSKPRQLLATVTRTLPAFQHQGLFISELFPDVPQVTEGNFRGRLEMEASIPELTGDLLRPPFAGLTLLSRGALLTSLPAAPHLPLFAPRAYLVPATDIAGSSPGACIRYSQRAGELTIQQARFLISRVSLDLGAAQDDTLGNYILDAATDVLYGRLFFSVEDDVVTFSPLVNPINEGEANLFSATARNVPPGEEGLPEGGVLIETATDPTLIDSESATTALGEYRSQICFDAGILQMPSEGEVTFHQELHSAPPFQYVESTVIPFPSTEPLLGVYEDVLHVAPQPQGTRIDQVDFISAIGSPMLSAGDTLIVKGAGFPSDPGDVMPVMHCGASQILGWTVADASPTEIRLEGTGEACRGDLQIMTGGGQASNRYTLNFRLTPQVEASLDSSQAGAQAQLGIRIDQPGDDLSFRQLVLRPSAGQFLTDGFDPEEVIGTLDFAIPGLETQQQFEWVVESSGPQQLVANALDTSDSDPDPQLMLTIDAAAGTLTLALPDITIPTTLPSRSIGDMQWTVPLFQLPGQNVSALRFEVEVDSQPLRALDPATALRAVQRISPQFP